MDPPKRELPWERLLQSFDVPFSGTYDPHNFVMSSFRPERLQHQLDAALGSDSVQVPEDLYTSGYADLKERVNYGRQVAERLARLGVTVTGVPPPSPFGDRYYEGREGSHG